ncbi:uncharacterized protein LOC124420457 isoform X1 [Lucilia cuprina]|uniref:uncharacterized protein LOC124420457 isoform X1 n=1 Tax=Lucilia cuprina TaxID=7375 RepID=UPI001F0642E5|nr:uncharacterized protein LOC124420457 isoform X1 [Lucilia cuprina]
MRKMFFLRQNWCQFGLPNCDFGANSSFLLCHLRVVVGVWGFFRSRKCVKDCLGGENLHRFPKDPTRHLIYILIADLGKIWSNSSISFRHLRILTADLGKFWSNSSISFRHLRMLTADPGEIWSNSSVSFRYYLPFFHKEQLIWS